MCHVNLIHVSCEFYHRISSKQILIREFYPNKCSSNKPKNPYPLVKARFSIVVTYMCYLDQKKIVNPFSRIFHLIAGEASILFMKTLCNRAHDNLTKRHHHDAVLQINLLHSKTTLLTFYHKAAITKSFLSFKYNFQSPANSKDFIPKSVRNKRYENSWT